MSQFLQFLPDFSNWTENTVGVAAGVLGTLLALIALIWQIISAWRQSRTQAMLRQNFGADFYPEFVLKDSTKYYVEPYCANVDPSREAEIRHVVATKEKLFNTLDDFLSKDSIYRHLIILADSGMGKTSALLNYYVRNQWRRRGRVKIVVVPLGIPNVDDYIKKIPDQKETILFLDAFDEDTKAIADHRERLADLMELCPQFSRVVMTCRTQFFPSDAEIPKETGIVRVGPRKAGEGAAYFFQKLYLMPLSDALVSKYLRKRYPIWRWVKRRKAKQLVEKMPLLSVRPMLLTHIPDLLQRKAPSNFGFELYEAMIEAWLERESHWVAPDLLRGFSERLAIDLFVNREKRGAEWISREELASLAREWGFSLQDWQMGGRSLLNRDGEGNYKFSHRSIMEYLFIRSKSAQLEIDWENVKPTDFMISLWRESTSLPNYSTWFHTFPGSMLNGEILIGLDLREVNLAGAYLTLANLSRTDLSGANLNKANLSGAYLRGTDLSGAYLSGANLSETDLSGANLNKANLSGANLSETNLGGANLSETDLNKANLGGANLSGANLSETDLNKANLGGANLSEANLSEANLSEADLGGANLSGANLNKTNLGRANLRGADLNWARYDRKTIWPEGYDYRKSGAIGPNADLREADLSKANLREADLSEADLSKANLRGTDLRGAYLGGANLSGANLRWAYLSETDLRGANLSETDLSGAYLSGANLSEANLSQANLSQANLGGANLGGADFSEANLWSANLRGAYLSEANLSQANLTEANLGGANLSGADFSEANLRRTDLSEANLGRTNLRGADLNWARYDRKTIWPEGYDYRRSGAIGPNANLSEANLSEANLSEADLSEANLSGANLRRTDLSEANLGRTNLRGADLNWARYDRKTIWPEGYDYRRSGAIGPNADLSEANLSGANLEGADLSGAKYTEDTVWPTGFDPYAAGAILVDDKGNPIDKE